MFVILENLTIYVVIAVLEYTLWVARDHRNKMIDHEMPSFYRSLYYKNLVYIYAQVF